MIATCKLAVRIALGIATVGAAQVTAAELSLKVTIDASEVDEHLNDDLHDVLSNIVVVGETVPNGQKVASNLNIMGICYLKANLPVQGFHALMVQNPVVGETRVVVWPWRDSTFDHEVPFVVSNHNSFALLLPVRFKHDELAGDQIVSLVETGDFVRAHELFKQLAGLYTRMEPHWVHDAADQQSLLIKRMAKKAKRFHQLNGRQEESKERHRLEIETAWYRWGYISAMGEAHSKPDKIDVSRIKQAGDIGSLWTKLASRIYIKQWPEQSLNELDANFLRHGQWSANGMMDDVRVLQEALTEQPIRDFLLEQTAAAKERATKDENVGKFEALETFIREENYADVRLSDIRAGISGLYLLGSRLERR